MARISGDNLSIQRFNGAAYVSIGLFRNFNISRARDRYDATAGGDANKVYVLGKKDFTGSAELVYDTTTIAALLGFSDQSTPQPLRLIPDLVGNPTHYWQGDFYFDVSVNVPQGVVTGTVNFVAGGNITDPV